jgi:hypothetical protein
MAGWAVSAAIWLGGEEWAGWRRDGQSLQEGQRPLSIRSAAPTMPVVARLVEHVGLEDRKDRQHMAADLRVFRVQSAPDACHRQFAGIHSDSGGIEVRVQSDRLWTVRVVGPRLPRRYR